MSIRTRTPVAAHPRRWRLERSLRRPLEVDFEQALAAARTVGGAVALDSSGGHPRSWSLVGFDPLAGTEGCETLADLVPYLDALPEVGPRVSVDPGARRFEIGFLGALAYDLGIAEEPLDLPAAPWDGPRIAGGIYTDSIWFDHEAGAAELLLSELVGEDGSPDPRGGLDQRLARLEAALDAPSADPRAPRPVGPVQRTVDGATHRARVERLRERIADGHVYQANLAHRSTLAVEGDALDLYRALRRANPAPYAGFLEFTDGAGRARALLSSSPELLVECDGHTARSRPIKGTAPRHDDPSRDAAARAELLASTKDLAELAMIVDLARNDLGRLARRGAVEIGALPELESYAAVHHLVCDVRARLRPEVRGVDLLASVFPAASISGAPKAAAMEAIAELEGEGRGFFCGSLGFLDRSGAQCFDVLIRTLEWRELAPGRGEVSLSVGGGITWDSDPYAEERETYHKARALLAALGADAMA